MLKAYWCRPDDWDSYSYWVSWDLIAAPSASKARYFAMTLDESCADCELTEIRVTRAKRADRYITGDKTYSMNDKLSAAGWRDVGGCGDPGEPQCIQCGLASCEGFRDRSDLWDVCDECHACGECGHDEDCELRNNEEGE